MLLTFALQAFAMRFDGPDFVTFKAVLLKHALIPEHKVGLRSAHQLLCDQQMLTQFILQAPSTSRVSVCDAAGKPAHNGPASLFASKTEQGSADLCECLAQAPSTMLVAMLCQP